MNPAAEPDKILPQGLTFDDVLLLPGYSDLQPGEADTTTRLTRDISLRIPLVSAAMDTVTESRTAIAMARQGGIGVLHRNMAIEEQAEEADRVKRSESGMITNPVTCLPDATLADVEDLCAHYRISGVPVTDVRGVLVGIVTNRDMRFESDLSRPVREVMTPMPLVTAPVGVSRDEAFRLLAGNKVEKLPLVDADGRLKGLITTKDFTKSEQYPDSTKDADGRLLVAAAVGVGDDAIRRARALVEAGTDVIIVDTAHGHSKGVADTIAAIKGNAPVQVVGGNVATQAGAKVLVDAGADAIKVGVGPGAACTTRVVAGVGVPQLTAVMECVAEADKAGVPIIADGGIRMSGDIVKAIAAGAGTVMIGSVLAGTEESPGMTVVRAGARYKVYRGSASAAVAIDRLRRERPEEDLDELAAGVVPEGVEFVVPHKGTVAQVVHQLVGGLRSGMSYLNARTAAELKANARFVRITEAGWRESLPHGDK
jgi:IMP dehydrogenase